MTTPRVQDRQGANLPVPYDHFHHIQDICDQNVANAVVSVLGGGIISVTVTPNSPADLKINVAQITGWCGYGKHLRKVATEEIDLTSLIPSSGSRYISLWAKFTWDNADAELDGNGNEYVPSRTESVTVWATSAVGLPTNPGFGAKRICSIQVTSSTTQITSAMIKTDPPYADKQFTISDLLPKSGGVMTGPIVYEPSSGGSKFVGLYSNHGKGVFGSKIWTFDGLGHEDSLSLTGDQNFDYHCLVTTNNVGGLPSIRTGIANNNLQLNLMFKLKWYNPDTGGTLDGWVSPVLMRRLSTISGEQPSEMIIPLFEESGGVYTGNIHLFVVGSRAFCESFAGREFRWTAHVPMPYSGLI